MQALNDAHGTRRPSDAVAHRHAASAQTTPAEQRRPLLCTGHCWPLLCTQATTGRRWPYRVTLPSHQASASLHLGQGHADDDARREGGGGHGEHAQGRHHGRRLGAGGVARAPGCSKAGTSATFGLALERRHCSLRYPSSGALLSGPEAAPSKRVGGSVSEWAGAVRGN